MSIFRIYYKQKQREEFKKESVYLSYLLNEIDVCSFQVFANHPLNSILIDYVQSQETYQIGRWNDVFASYMESLIGNNFFIRDVVFFTLADDQKKPLTVREDLTFSEINSIKFSYIWKKTITENGKIVWSNNGSTFNALRLIKNHKTGSPIGILCFYLHTKNFHVFATKIKYLDTLFLLDHDESVLYPFDLQNIQFTRFPFKAAGWYRVYKNYVYISLKEETQKVHPLKLAAGNNFFKGLFLFSSIPLFLAAILFFLYAVFYFRFYKKRRVMDLQTQDQHLPAENLKMLFELSERELLVLELICQGLAGKEIAFKLKLKEQTVKNYTSKLYKKMGVSSRIAACQFINSLNSINSLEKP